MHYLGKAVSPGERVRRPIVAGAPLPSSPSRRPPPPTAAGPAGALVMVACAMTAPARSSPAIAGTPDPACRAGTATGSVDVQIERVGGRLPRDVVGDREIAVPDMRLGQDGDLLVIAGAHRVHDRLVLAL